ncbi:hypothetical protein Y1Q_0007541 [Alligator mississippiensis]|uniref:Uncharacterized protein n=1 Tax=Alligator mississippiensis TaxID=8496 RepID=A0A151M577_ALLMI|nr:hypothetical protein Y1Q_0007541 [Alligator mississippiensis]
MEGGNMVHWKRYKNGNEDTRSLRLLRQGQEHMYCKPKMALEFVLSSKQVFTDTMSVIRSLFFPSLKPISDPKLNHSYHQKELALGRVGQEGK